MYPIMMSCVSIEGMTNLGPVARLDVPQTEQVRRGAKKGRASAALRHNRSGAKKAWREGRPKPHFLHCHTGKMAIFPSLVIGLAGNIGVVSGIFSPENGRHADMLVPCC